MSGETKPFSHEFMCTTNIPVFYDHGYPTGIFADFLRSVEGQKSKIMKFLYEIMNPEDVDLFLDFLAYCLYREYKYNYWMLLVGKGLNGKSILLTLIERFLEGVMFPARLCIDFLKRGFRSPICFKRWQMLTLTFHIILFSTILVY